MTATSLSRIALFLQDLSCYPSLSLEQNALSMHLYRIPVREQVESLNLGIAGKLVIDENLRRQSHPPG